MSAIYNPWAESLGNCLIGKHHLRSQEYRDLIDELDRLYSIETENKRLRAALELYGGHGTDCGLNSGLSPGTAGDCTCGLDALLKEG